MSELPPFLHELLANPPTAGAGVHSWLFCVARHLHAHLGTMQMEALLREKLQNCGRHVPTREIREAINHSASCAWTPDQRWTEGAHPKPEPKNQSLSTQVMRNQLGNCGKPLPGLTIKAAAFCVGLLGVMTENGRCKAVLESSFSKVIKPAITWWRWLCTKRGISRATGKSRN